MKKKINVLLSSYNGEKYIQEQIDSILNQTYQNIELYVRDDGSTDNTVNILKKYEKQGLLHLEEGENIGFIKSFQWLIANGGEADYYAFSDQDDAWCDDKLVMALEKLESTDAEKPVLYFSNYDYYDKDLNFISHHDSKIPNISFVNALVDCVSLGISSVFNRRAKDMVTENMPEQSCGHDWWMYMVCAGMGQVVYDDRPTVKYRRHGNNVSDGGDSFLKFQIWRFKKFFLNHYFRKIHEQLKEYAGFYMDQLVPEKQNVLKLFIADGVHPFITLRKVFYPVRFRQGLIDEMFLRCVMIIGRL